MWLRRKTSNIFQELSLESNSYHPSNRRSKSRAFSPSNSLRSMEQQRVEQRVRKRSRHTSANPCTMLRLCLTAQPSSQLRVTTICRNLSVKASRRPSLKRCSETLLRVPEVTRPRGRRRRRPWKALPFRWNSKSSSTDRILTQEAKVN